MITLLDELGKRGVGFKSLKDTWADTTTAHGRLMLTVLGGLAEFERELIRKRAKERGVRFGRPRKLTPHQRQEALQRLVAGCFLRRHMKKSNHRHRWLLRACRERPRNRAAEQRYELTPLHVEHGASSPTALHRRCW